MLAFYFKPSATGRVVNHQTRLPRATSSLALNASRDGASTTSLGNLFQCNTILRVKNFLLISNLNPPCLSLRPSPLVLSLSTLVNSRSPSCLYSPFKYWKAQWGPAPGSWHDLLLGRDAHPFHRQLPRYSRPAACRERHAPHQAATRGDPAEVHPALQKRTTQDSQGDRGGQDRKSVV